MSTYTPKPGSGQLFKNDRKQSDSHPDYKGSFALPDGTMMEIAAWLKEGQRGKFMSLKVQPQRQRSDSYEPRGGGGSTPRDEFNVDEGDSIPFASAWGLR